MNILILHNAYQQRGGEDTVVDAEASLLREAGHVVHVEVVSNNAIQTVGDKISLVAATAYNARRGQWLKSLIVEKNVDVVHIHNFFPLLTPAVHEAAADHGTAVVQTLHNYRLICAGANLLREGGNCEKCIGGSKLWGAVHRCYRGSLAGSMAVVAMQLRANRSGTWSRHVHRFIALSKGGKKKFVEAGLPAERIAIKPNFVAAPPGTTEQMPRKGILFVGRISPEKGLDVLLDAMRELPAMTLTVVGDGPDLAASVSRAPANARYLGRRSANEVMKLMAHAQALVVPSIWQEPFPMTVLEALSNSLPVIASKIGGLAEIVRHGHDGMLFEPGNVNELVRTLQTLSTAPEMFEAMGHRARETHQALYSPKANLAMLENIYLEALEEARQVNAGTAIGTVSPTRVPI